MKKLNINKLGHDLRVKRAEDDINQTKLAALIGTTQPVIAAIESQKRINFKFNTILGVLEYMNKSLNEYII